MHRRRQRFGIVVGQHQSGIAHRLRYSASIGRDDGQSGRHRFYQRDPKAFMLGGAHKDVGKEIQIREFGVPDRTMNSHAARHLVTLGHLSDIGAIGRRRRPSDKVE